MYTVDTALESLRKYDIQEADLNAWEDALSLDIPVDAYGRKEYSPHHVNLFKNVKKHIALGRTLQEIKQLISLPPIETSRPQEPVISTISVAPAQAASSYMPSQQIPPQSESWPQPEPKQSVNQEPLSPPPLAQPKTVQPKVVQKSAYASVPKRPVTQGSKPNGAASVVGLVQNLNQEKEQLYKKLLETEKLNSHLYSANSLFHKKVQEMGHQIKRLQESLNENERFKLLDDKARLHRQLIEAEKLNQAKQEEIENQRRQQENLRRDIQTLQQKIAAMNASFNPQKFCGDWMENGRLIEVVYDNFGINIETERVRLFRISEKPERLYGATAFIQTSYQYETNNLWKREETLVVSYIDEHTLEGELIAEYILDGVPVAKAVYRVTCNRSQSAR